MQAKSPWLRRVKSAGAISQSMALIGLTVTCLLASTPARAADDAQEASQLVDKAQLTLQSFLSDNNMGAVRDLLKTAKGVFIAPQVLKGAFILGASGGSGVFLVRDGNTSTWSAPAFYTLGGVSFGLQAGGESSEVVLLAMSERGVSAMLTHTFKLGADASVAVGPVGAGVSGATAALSADLVSFSRAKGLYGGISLDGSVVAVRDDWNQAYYGRDVTPTDILINKTVRSRQAAQLMAEVSKAATAR